MHPDRKGPFTQEEFDKWYDEHCDDDLEYMSDEPHTDIDTVVPIDYPFSYSGYPV